MRNGIYETVGRVVETPQGVTIITPRPAADHMGDTVRVVWSDARTITPIQRRKIYALLADIANGTGYTKDEAKAALKAKFRAMTIDDVQRQAFSLSDCSVSEASGFIEMLIDLILELDIQTAVPLTELCDDVQRYVYACLMHNKCCVCGKKNDLHHVDRVGMGYDRHEINHIGLRCLPLCREHHQQAHQIGETRFEELYHLQPVEIDERIAKHYKLKGVTT